MVDRTIHISLAGMDAMHEGFAGGVSHAAGRRPARAPDLDHDHEREDHGHGHNHDDHDDHDAASAAHDADHHEPEAVTAFLVGLKSKGTVLRYQRAVNTYRGEALTAVIPGVALAQLWRVLGPAEQALRAISVLVVVAGLSGLLTALLSTLNERRREIAVLRAVGARRRDVFALLVLEATLIAGLGAAIGAVAVNLAFAGFARGLEAAVGAPLGPLGVSVYDAYIVGAVTALGFLLGLVPGWIAYRRSLSDGLTIRV